MKVINRPLEEGKLKCDQAYLISYLGIPKYSILFVWPKLSRSKRLRCNGKYICHDIFELFI